MVGSSVGRVLFVGSRGLGAEAAALARSCVAEALARGRVVGAGCAVGADALALEAVVAEGGAARCRVFAAFGPDGAGSWSGSAVSVVSRAVLAGCRVSWLAGGPLSVELRARLAARSGAAVRWAAEGGAGSGVVGFLASPSSLGSVGSLRLAARLGVPVVVWCVGFPGRLLPALGPLGSWVCLPSGGWLWFVPAVAVQAALPGVRVASAAEGMGVGPSPRGAKMWCRRCLYWRRFDGVAGCETCGYQLGVEDPNPKVQREHAPEVRLRYAGGDSKDESMSRREMREWDAQGWKLERRVQQYRQRYARAAKEVAA